jgi:hypothetical protein
MIPLLPWSRLQALAGSARGLHCHERGVIP